MVSETHRNLIEGKGFKEEKNNRELMRFRTQFSIFWIIKLTKIISLGDRISFSPNLFSRRSSCRFGHVESA